MAKPIKETPILRGNDAEKFTKENEKAKKISKELNARMESNFNKLNAIAKF
ncbi:hypothetical protein [Emticicia sp. 17c]|uniref:hypothetical protein n=1 Tax=Emticicia sp. 17c TaxID=3127704 RepID=UPI00301DFCB1